MNLRPDTKTWPHSLQREVIALQKQGLSCNEIAKKIGRSQCATAGILRRLSLQAGGGGQAGGMGAPTRRGRLGMAERVVANGRVDLAADARE